MLTNRFNPPRIEVRKNCENIGKHPGSYSCHTLDLLPGLLKRNRWSYQDASVEITGTGLHATHLAACIRLEHMQEPGNRTCGDKQYQSSNYTGYGIPP